MIPLQPDDGPAVTGTTTVPVDGGWAQAWAQIEQALHAIPVPAWYITAGLVIVAGLLASVRIAVAGKKNTRRRKSDKVLTFLAAAVATGVVATGMWKFFGDVLHITNPVGRTALFAFFEIAMLASAFRSRRFRLDRAAKRDVDPDDPDPRIDVDGIAVWVLATLSGLFASADEPTVTGKLVRIVAPLLAAWMWERGLAGELMQFTRSAKHINWALTPERILVWLGAADPSGRQIGEVARKRRVAKFSRTAYRLQIMKEDAAFKWRIGWVRWRLRRLTESANEHLNLATDRALLGEVRAQLALLYGVEDGTSRKAVADLHPLEPAEQLAIADRPFAPPSQDGSQEPSRRPLRILAPRFAKASQRRSLRASRTARTLLRREGVNESPAANALERAAEKAPERAVASAPAKAAKPARTPVEAIGDDGPESVRKLAAAYARKPGGTNTELAKLAKVSVGSANRHLPKIRAAANARENSDDSQERAQSPLNLTPFAALTPPALTPVNGYSHTTQED
jgi:hypothetical protein